MVKSISYDQTEIISNILELHVPEHKIDCDPTFSKGVFYKDTGIELPKYKFDIYPQSDDSTSTMHKIMSKPFTEDIL